MGLPQRAGRAARRRQARRARRAALPRPLLCAHAGSHALYALLAWAAPRWCVRVNVERVEARAGASRFPRPRAPASLHRSSRCCISGSTKVANQPTWGSEKKRVALCHQNFFLAELSACEPMLPVSSAPGGGGRQSDAPVTSAAGAWAAALNALNAADLAAHAGYAGALALAAWRAAAPLAARLAALAGAPALRSSLSRRDAGVAAGEVAVFMAELSFWREPFQRPGLALADRRRSLAEGAVLSAPAGRGSLAARAENCASSS